jgi:hypothetical protein
MEHFHVAANEAGVRVAGVLGWLCGSAHRRTTFPIPLVGNDEFSANADQQPAGRYPTL